MILTIDKNAYSELKRGSRKVQDYMESVDSLIVPIIVIGELIAGFRNGSNTNHNIKELEMFLSEPDIDIISIDYTIADRYGQIIKDLKRKGKPIPSNDIWIGALALENGARLLTADKHFESIDGLMLYGF